MSVEHRSLTGRQKPDGPTHYLRCFHLHHLYPEAIGSLHSRGSQHPNGITVLPFN